MVKVRLTHDDIWLCTRKLDCVLHGHCLEQVHKGRHACAPYPGPPNYPVPTKIKDPVSWFATNYRLLSEGARKRWLEVE